MMKKSDLDNLYIVVVSIKNGVLPDERVIPIGLDVLSKVLEGKTTWTVKKEIKHTFGKDELKRFKDNYKFLQHKIVDLATKGYR
ncbi:hypothetical protein BH792_gp110 [Staphylococcus phage Stau2]|uniref:Uncharacterized protein n=1 Tax=Staphylococcus phage Stau2 TaxID=1200862 RepID=A0A0U1ZUF3_9CAUD|nr:hypothetical protein BH792_gp110 [Staphylococcus phage Stau2]ARQ95937.1 hypothetical protein qdsa001_181 [Staphylococcus phage qdsa001]UGL60791.1 hypothetical protein [Staphylococcus phage vB_SauM-HM01]BBM81355.1 hypothetical protein [Staphylococcus phage KSAP7]BBM81543.1 hypothetical protein [Staphylococcus phage KSAP11]BEU75303.1 hypothetical protein RNIID_0910 [Staphylococcus phage phiRNIID]